MDLKIAQFRGPFYFLSNFYPATVTLNRMEFPTVEHAYQAAKTNSRDWRKRVQECDSPAQAKAMGRVLPVRRHWDDLKLDIMYHLVSQKFRNHPGLRDALAHTGTREIEEGNHWGDQFWGVFEGRGQNHLGKIIMRVRSEL